MLANGFKELHEAVVVPRVLAQVVGYFGYLLLAGYLLVRSNKQRGVTP